MVRIYCLSSISTVPESTNYNPPNPYDAGADEILLNDGYHNVLNHDTFLPKYLLTEICIGWKATDDGTKKFYELQIYRKNMMLLNFRMIRGIITIENMDFKNGSFELNLFTSKFSTFHQTTSPNFDLKFKILFIKNTTVKRIISNEEELAYDDYAKNISNFCNENADQYPDLSFENLQMTAIKQLGPLILPNQTRSKFLRQKIRDFQRAIYLLCNPQNGSFANIPVNEYDPETKKSKVCRFYQQIENLLFLRQSTWHAKESRAIQKQTDKFRECIYLDWANASLRHINSDAFALQNLQAIDFDKVDLGESLKYWYSFASKVNFKYIYSITLNNCGLKYLDDKFFHCLSRETQCLCFMNNDIKYISPEIIKLPHLGMLDLSNNKNLSDDGITWYRLPSSLVELNLENTNIINVPEYICWIKALTNFKVRSPQLKSISWTDFNQYTSKLSIAGGGNEINEIELGHVIKLDLTISNLKLNKLDHFNLPCNLISLRLIDTHLGTFNTSDIKYKDEEFDELELSGNDLAEFSWEGCPQIIKQLILSNNQLDNISIRETTINFTNFAELTVISFERNKISSLPEGFENLPQLLILNLSLNYFDYKKSDLMTVLWHRLPKTLTCLNLSNNNIIVIPCLLKNFAIQNLRIAKCNLQYFCPYLHRNIQDNENYMVIDASNNPNFNISFIPSTIFKLPKISEIKPTTGNPKYQKDMIPNYSNFPTTTLIGNFCDTSKTSYIKAVYKFNSEGVVQNDKYVCKCCGMCGNATNEPLFKQQMAPDSILLIQEEEGIEDTRTTTYHSNFKPPIYYNPGQWRTEVKSRLCFDCKKIILDKIEKAFDTKTKKKRCDSESLNENIHEETQHELPRKNNGLKQQQNFENIYNDVAMESEPETITQLPPIKTLYSNHEDCFRNDYFQTINQPFAPSPFDRTVLLDQYGKECATWEHNNSTNTPIYLNAQAFVQEEIFPQPTNDTHFDVENLFDNFEFSPTSDEMLSWCNL